MWKFRAQGSTYSKLFIYLFFDFLERHDITVHFTKTANEFLINTTSFFINVELHYYMLFITNVLLKFNVSIIITDRWRNYLSINSFFLCSFLFLVKWKTNFTSSRCFECRKLLEKLRKSYENLSMFYWMSYIETQFFFRNVVTKLKSWQNIEMEKRNIYAQCHSVRVFFLRHNNKENFSDKNKKLKFVTITSSFFDLYQRYEG